MFSDARLHEALTILDKVVATSDTADVLERIIDPEVHLTLWTRELPVCLHDLQWLDWDGIDDIDHPVAVEALAKDVPTLIDEAGYGAAGASLAEELVVLSMQFGAIMGCGVLRLRLEVVETDACRRFHADNVTARLLMPLVGPGTQWIHAGIEAPVYQLRPGEVGVFKGRQWTETPHILHRSPPISATGETRLLFALNPYTIGEMA